MTVYMVTHDDRIKEIREAAEKVQGAGDSYRMERLRETIDEARAELASLEHQASEGRQAAEEELLTAAGWHLTVYDAEKEDGKLNGIYRNEALGIDLVRGAAVGMSLGLASMMSIPYEEKYKEQAAIAKARTVTA